MANRPNAIDEIAFAWAAKTDAGPLNDQDQARLNCWVEQDPRHAGAFARALAANLHLDRATALGPDFDPLPRAVSPSAARTNIGRRQMLIGSSALAMAVIGGGFGAAILQRGRRIETAKGVIQRHPLADGSSMVLNTATEVELDYIGTTRRIALLGGEAEFDVVKDPARPFIVVAGDVTVRAIGTRFSVWRHDDGSTHVVVTEGIVEIGRSGETLIGNLVAGQRAHIAEGGAFDQTSLSPESLDHATAWTNGMIDMNGLSLGEAAEQFRRYSDVRITFGDARLAALRVSGTYSINNAIGFARDAALSLDLDTAKTDDGILIRTKN